MQKELEKDLAALPQWIIEGNGLRLELGHRTLVMGILNVTPDSFSDGGKFLTSDQAVSHAVEMAAEGADLIDVGGESSRPRSEPIPVEEELRRVIPVIEQIAKRVTIPISIDTTKAEVASRALSAGARLINDVTALRHDPEMVKVAAGTGTPVILMHMQGTPRTMQQKPAYDSVIDSVREFFVERLSTLSPLGVPREKTILDPGIGFGKTTQHNLALIRLLNEFQELDRPILIGPSRKSFMGDVLGLPVEERIEGTAAAVTAAVLNGASMVRVHDVKAMSRVVQMADALKKPMTTTEQK